MFIYTASDVAAAVVLGITGLLFLVYWVWSWFEDR